ncbi:D-xylose ABC transporter substrate-binding protein [Clostridium sediminicola]|uniref:D-xylose ABC transporter substrate-binding protein n=1 Tax=Clostridium sediminicola TaxID=3114879 RepID=UPI0031F21130
MFNEKRKRLNVLVAIVIIAIICSIIFSMKKVKNNISKNDNKVIIGLSIDSLAIERWQRDRDIFVAKAKELGADVIVQNSNGNSDEQLKQVNYLMDQNIDVLVVIPNDADALTSIVKTAKNKGIKVISYDRLVKNADVDLYISFDNVKVGELMAKSLVKKAPEGNYIIINGSEEDYNTYFMNKGFKNVLDPYINKGKIAIVKEVWASGWREEVAYKAVEEALSSGTKIDAILCGNDRLAESAIEALAEKRLAGKVFVAGQDATLSACQRIVEDSQHMTVYKPIQKLAQKAAEISVGVANSKILDVNDNLENGQHTVLYHKEDVYAVTKENMMEVIIEGKFHNEEDVYMRK